MNLLLINEASIIEHIFLHWFVKIRNKFNYSKIHSLNTIMI